MGPKAELQTLSDPFLILGVAVEVQEYQKSSRYFGGRIMAAQMVLLLPSKALKFTANVIFKKMVEADFCLEWWFTFVLLALWRLRK